MKFTGEKFFSYILFHFPHAQKTSFRQKFQKIPWSKSEEYFKKWSEGKTGFPIVDAGMRQLNETGFMHNRVRMIVASFLTKDLHIDWRLGEKYFAEKLIDYDPAVNSGNCNGRHRQDVIQYLIFEFLIHGDNKKV